MHKLLLSLLLLASLAFSAPGDTVAVDTTAPVFKRITATGKTYYDYQKLHPGDVSKGAVLANPSNRGVRTMPGYMSSAAAAPTLGATGLTQHYTFELPTQFDAVQLIVSCRNKSSDASNSPLLEFQAVVAHGSSLATDNLINGNSDTMSALATWQNYRTAGGNTYGRFHGTGNADANGKMMSSSALSVNGEVLVVSNLIECRSITRVDGGTFPILHVRLGILTTTSGTGGAAVIKSRSAASWDTAGKWNAVTGGYRHYVRSQAGVTLNAGAVGSGFTATTEVSQYFLAGVIYYSRGKVMNVSMVGGSTALGGAATNMMGWHLPLVQGLDSAYGIPHEYSVIGVGEGDWRTHQEELAAWLPVIQQPDIVVVNIGDLGDIYSYTTTYEAANAGLTVRGTRSGFSVAADLIRKQYQNAYIVPATWIPCGTGFSQDSADANRHNYNWLYRNNAAYSATLFDPDTLVSDGQPRGAFLAPYASANTFHMNRAGYLYTYPYLKGSILRNVRIKQ